MSEEVDKFSGGTATEGEDLGNGCVVSNEDVLELQGTSILNKLAELAEATGVDQYVIGISDTKSMDFRIASKCVGMFFAGSSMAIGTNANEEQSDALFNTLCSELNAAQASFEEGHPGINSKTVDMDLINAFEASALELCGEDYDLIAFFGCIALSKVVKVINISNEINGVLFSQRLQIASLSTDIAQSHEFIKMLQNDIKTLSEKEA